MKTEYYLEHRGATGATEHQKYYRIQVDGVVTTFTWGAIGAKKPGTEVKNHGSESEAFAYAETKLKAKRGGGYQLIRESQSGNAPQRRTTLTGQSPFATRRPPEQVVRHEERPPEEGRRFGFEVETHSNLDPQQIATRLTERGLKVNYRAGAYFHSEGMTWDVKHDSSCGYEFASPILRGEAGIFDIKLALEKIREVCQEAVTAKCGIHVTIDVSDHSEADLLRLFIGYLKAQEHFYARCNKTRQNNVYCLRNPVGLLATISDARFKKLGLLGMEAIRVMTNNPRGSRYHGLNIDRVRTRKVVEFRMLESTVDARKVGAWVRTCVGFVDGLKASGVKFTSGGLFSAETFEQIIAGDWSPARVPVLS